MCLAVPGQVLAIAGDSPFTRTGRVSFLDVVKEVSLALVPEVTVNDYVLVHAGVAITILDQEQAQKTLDYLGRLEQVIQSSEFPS